MILNKKQCSRNTLNLAFDCPWENKNLFWILSQTVFRELLCYIYEMFFFRILYFIVCL